MKKIIITLTLLLVLAMTTAAVAQRHRHTPQQTEQTELVDSTSKNAIEAFSDTTSTTTTTTTTTTYEVDDDDFGGMIHNAFSQMRGKDIAGMFFVLCVLLIIFVLAPVFIIIALFYFINKNRKDKMRLAQMAMQQGQPIPEQLLNDQPINDNEEYKNGIRQCFVGVGLMIFLGYAAGTVGFGVGALVFCIGLGKVFVSRTTHKKYVDDKNDITKL